MWPHCLCKCYPVNFLLPTVLSAHWSLALGFVFCCAAPSLTKVSQTAATTSWAVPVCITASHLLGLPAFSGEGWCSPMGSSTGLSQVNVSQAVNRTGNSEAVAAPRLIEGENCISSCARLANVMIAFSSEVAMLPDTALHGVPCTMCSIANRQLQALLTLWRHKFFCWELYLPSRSKVEGLQRQHDLGLPREGTQVLRSSHGMKWWAELASAEQSLTSCGKSWYSEWGSRGGDASQWFTSCQGIWDFAELRQWFVQCMACRGMMPVRIWGTWLQTEGSHSRHLEAGHQSGAWVPSFQWKLRTCVISGTFSLCLSSSGVK